MSDDSQFKFNVIEGMSRFSGARGRAFWKEMFNLLRGGPMELLSFDDIKHRLRLREESYRGLQEVPIEKIAGSVGRYRDFTRDFLPKSKTSKERWSRVYAAANSQLGLPPIELYKVGDVYFVRDGNHRVSVARSIGSKYIEAHVTELPTSIELHAGMSQDEIENATAYAAFLEESTINRVRPHHQSLRLSERSRYSELLGHIYLHKSMLEFIGEGEVRVEDAASHWYDHVYRPALTLIRKYDMMKNVPDRTEADLYLWIVDHLRELREQFGQQAPRKISDALVDFLQERGLPVPGDLLEEPDESLIISRTQLMRAVQQMNDPPINGNGNKTDADEPPPEADKAT